MVTDTRWHILAKKLAGSEVLGEESAYGNARKIHELSSKEEVPAST